MKQTNFPRSVIRIIPAFAIIAIVAVSIAHLARVPQSQLASVVLVPLIVSFLLTRIAVLVVPHIAELTPEQEKDAASVPLVAKGLVIAMIASAAFAAVAFPSSGIYKAIGLGIVSNYVAHLASLSAIILIAAWVLLVVTAVANEIQKSTLKLIADADIAAFWRFARCPGVIAAAFLGHLGRHQT